jgi:benzoylformate decarboxylase
MRERIVQLLAGSDVVFALGAPAFTYHVEGVGPHLPSEARLVQLIEDPATAAWGAGRNRCGREHPPFSAGPARAHCPADASRSTEEHATFARRGVGAAVGGVRAADAGGTARSRSIIVEEAPSSRAPMHDHLPILESETFYTMCSGGLGYGLPAAVGVALAKPAKKVIGLVGDGSAMYSIQALWTPRSSRCRSRSSS